MTLAGAESAAAPHRPVMLREVLEALAPRDGGIYVDGTFGAGGAAKALLDAADCRVWGIDRDPEALAGGAALVERYAGRLTLVEGRFGEMDRLMAARGTTPVDGVALDLGVSSMQIDRAERGFSFRADGPLDMRMAGPAQAAGPSAAEVVNSLSEGELADVLYRYGEERKSRPIARAIVAARRERPLERTLELAEIVRRVIKRGPEGLDPATRSFQALRIYVNDELGELQRGLRAAERLLRRSGRLAVIAFHSLEDRVVKDFLRERSGGGGRGSRHLPATAEPERAAATFRLLFKGVRRPEASEVAANPRARSARLRAAERTAAAAWSDSETGGTP
jgi:16S rRNA (cytosine1402-N4)-methyltransferase